MYRRPRAGFTLVELLVVIRDHRRIGVGHLARRAGRAREAGRRMQCRNNLKQMALASNIHLDTHKFFPTAGWGWTWAGDPNYGFDLNQPGGWMYNILPYIEEQALHDLGKGTAENSVQRKTAIKSAIETVVPLYFCPTRRPAQVLPYTHSGNYVNAQRPAVVARNDCVACSGDRTDGDTDQGWNMGHDSDIVPFFDTPPYNDALGQPPRYTVFGSAHHGGIQVAMADGSVHTIPYEIDPIVFRRLGIRNDGLPASIP